MLDTELSLLEIDIGPFERHHLSGASGPRYTVPARLSTHDFHEAAQPPVRRVSLSFMRMNWFIDRRTFDLRDVADAELVAPGCRRRQSRPGGG